MQKKRMPYIMASILEHNKIPIPFALSADLAPGPAASSFLKKLFNQVKIASGFSIRHSHAATASTWPTTWFSTYWR